MIKKSLFTSLVLFGLILLCQTNAASISLVSSGDIIKDCPTEIKIMIDSEDEQINSAGINLFLSESFVVNDYKTTRGVFREYFPIKKLKSQSVDHPNKEYLRLIASSSSPNGYKGTGEFGTLTITPKSDELNLEIYMKPGHEGEDSSLIVRNEDGTVSDKLTKANNIKIKTKEGICETEQLGEIQLEEINSKLTADEVQTEIEGKIEIKKSNVFDKSQENNRFKKNRLYLVIVGAILVLIGILLKKKDSKK